MGVSSLFTSFPLAMSNWLVFAVSLGFLNIKKRLDAKYDFNWTL